MPTTIGLPSLTITFQTAARAAANRSKRGYVGVFVRDTKSQGVHQLSSAALIPSDLGADNQAYLERAFTGSDRGAPSKVVAVVINTGKAYTGSVPTGTPAAGAAASLNLTVDGKAVSTNAVLAEGNYYVPASFLATLGVNL